MLFTRRKNDLSPRMVAATVVGKREHVSRQAYCRTCAVQPSEMAITHYVTFRVDGGDSLELVVPKEEYELLLEGDSGMLTFRGTQYLGFGRG